MPRVTPQLLYSLRSVQDVSGGSSPHEWYAGTILSATTLRFAAFVPEEGLEPSHLAVHDFESCASTDSATPA